MNRIKTREKNQNVVQNLTRFKYNFKDDRVIAQIAIAYSLQRRDRFKVEDFEKSDNKGKEYPESLLGTVEGQSNDSVYKVVFSEHYKRRLSDTEFMKLLKLHLDAGLEAFERDILSNNKGKNAHIDYLMSIINTGLSLSNDLVNVGGFSKTTKELSIPAYKGLLEVNLGKDVSSEESVNIRINDERRFDSQHFAVAGMNGSGKTELIKDVLYQLHQQSNGDLNFIFFDYKGEGKSGKLKSFLDATNCDFVDVQSEPFAFNPLSYIDLVNKRQREYDIKAFKETLGSIDGRIGVKQKNSLQTAINRCFEDTLKEGRHPTMHQVKEALDALYEENGEKPDTLTAIIDDVAGGVFAEDYDPECKLYDKNIYVNLPVRLPDTTRQASVFLMLNYLLLKFIACDDVRTSEERIKPIRYVIVIDEAHAYLKSKNMAKILEDLLRMIRSKGVIVMMLSQGVAEFKQKEFDFSSQVKIPVLLNVQHKDLKTAKSFLGTPKSEYSMKEALRNLNAGKGVVNFGGPSLIDINMFWQRGL